MPRMTCASFVDEIVRNAPFFEEIDRWQTVTAEVSGLTEERCDRSRE